MAIKVTFLIRRDTAANWTTVNPTLRTGEPGIETDTRRVKYGNGVDSWTALPYASVPMPAGGTNGQILQKFSDNDFEFTWSSLTAGIVAFTPTGTIAATNVQSAIAEVASEAVRRVSSTDNAIAQFNGTNGAIQNSNIIINDSGTPGLRPSANDGAPLGVSGTAWSDLFLASGGVINFNAGNATLTHSAGLLTSNVPIAVPDDAYGAGWDGSLATPTKNAIYDKIQSLPASGSGLPTGGTAGQIIRKVDGTDYNVAWSNLTAGIVAFTPVGGIAATDVQGAIAELDAEKVGGPGASTDNALVRWNGTAGFLVQSSGVIVDDSDNITGVTTLEVDDDAYGAGWNGSLRVPTKNAIWDKIESLPASGSGIPTGGTAGQIIIKVNSTDYNVAWGNLTAGIVSFTPTGTIAATTVQGAIAELEAERDAAAAPAP